MTRVGTSCPTHGCPRWCTYVGKGRIHGEVGTEFTFPLASPLRTDDAGELSHAWWALPCDFQEDRLHESFGRPAGEIEIYPLSQPIKVLTNAYDETIHIMHDGGLAGGTQGINNHSVPRYLSLW